MALSSLVSVRASAQYVVREIIDSTGDGAGNSLDLPIGIARDAWGNTYVIGEYSANAFKITPSGVITEIIDRYRVGVGNFFVSPKGIAVDSAGNVYVVAAYSSNAVKSQSCCKHDGLS